ncbi:thioredoxin domain-containing protein [Candidatus Bathyarchaeota archaeon]|nr:MAG: hypothetical protein AUJ07_00200 [Crenarchaeota archaeon 13_1_40CM_3_53_5]TMI27540.1 MAG: thioredoxin domain-containing protein [Candidatus Bathyarchaeota archaeon]TMI31004.1 MAG: thioredoxin domain-containing protein [Candidatus Bathyarchaeota archaeon]
MPSEIQWLEWGRESFEKARTTGRPILLDITGSWCHWCHVMDKTSYSDPVIIDTVSKHFVPVRVDTDKRPDVNRRYNMGGWPTTAFLDGEGKVITGGTYIPPQQLREVLRSVLDYYTKSKGKARSKLESTPLPKATGEPLTERIGRDIATSIAVNFDIDYGGFGFEPKFPNTDALEYSLLRYRYVGEKEMLTVVNRTLDKMARGGVYDQVEKGFFRYSTTRDWSIPHFEKMAEDNARLLGVYIRAYQVTANPFYREVAEGIVSYVRNNLLNPAGDGFYGSQDADEEYYKLGLEERKKKTAPSIDRTLYANYNAEFVSSLLLASPVLDEPGLGKISLKALERITKEAGGPAGLSHYWDAGASAPSGFLVDHAWSVNALLDAYEFTGEWKYVEAAEKLTETSLRTLYDREDGGFYDIPESTSVLGELLVRDKPMDENSNMALALSRLSWTVDKESYMDMAKRTLDLYMNDHEKYGVMAATYAIALDRLLNGAVGITIVGSSRTKEFKAFKSSALKMYSGRRSVLYLDKTKDTDRIKKQSYDASDSTKAYVCVGKVCGPPLKSPSQIQESLSQLLTTAPLATGN